MNQENAKKTLLVITNNHFDQTWRRCWERPFENHGLRFISYADLEEYYMLDNLAIARQYPEYKFEAECTYVLRKFLERHPEALNELRQLYQAGRFAVTGGGEAIIDGNMVQGESLVRNYVDGFLWVEEVLGQPTRLAVRNDAFGNPAQLPQILRGCEVDWATGMSYTRGTGLYWRGLDGSTILHRTVPIAGSGGGNTKYPPCAACGGTGVAVSITCPVCQGRGIDINVRAWLPGDINDAALESFGAGLIMMGPEELLPNPQIIQWAEAMRSDPTQPYDVRFALEEDLIPYVSDWLKNVDTPSPDSLHPDMELNPNNSGCLVTRIKTKQNVRRQEYRLLAAETLGVMSALRGMEYPLAELKQIRHNQFFTMFHDAITATHIDAAYEELQDYWKKIDHDIDSVRARIDAGLVDPSVGADLSGTLSVINPHSFKGTAVVSATVDQQGPLVLVDESGRSVPVLSRKAREDNQSVVEFLVSDLPAFSARTYQVKPAANDAGVKDIQPSASVVIENHRFRVNAGVNGLESVFDKTLNREVLSAGEYLPAELILEHDEGSPWATLHADQSQVHLSPYTFLDRVETAPGYQKVWFNIEVPREAGLSGKCLRAKLSITLVEGIERVDFHMQVDWDGFNHRLRVAMPVPFCGKHMYEVPYGILERQPYEPWFRWAGANGDWPAINWAGVEGQDISVALFNQGTPSYKIETGEERSVILLSLLRSPAIPTYLHEPEFYTMTEYDGMRDMGSHEFHFAVAAYAGPVSQSSVVMDADLYNAGFITVPGRVMLPVMPAVQSGPARITAIKWAEQNRAFIVRLVEFRGSGREAVISLPSNVTKVEKVNLLERQPEELPIKNRQVRLGLRSWEIATLKLYL